jgi:uncharacterized membrane protein YjjP (DUF1212 family)
MTGVRTVSHEATEITELEAAAECLLRFAASMLRAGDIGFRAREAIDRLAAKMALRDVVVALAFESVTLDARRDGESVTLVRRLGSPGINADRIRALERLSRDAPRGVTPQELTVQLDGIDAKPPLRNAFVVALAVGLACASFAFLNDGGPGPMLAAAIGGGIGQFLRMKLLAHKLNQFVTTAICAIAASAIYCLLATALALAGANMPSHAAGFISSVLFLVPGFPMVAAVIDVVQGDLTVGVTRFAYCMTLVMAAAFGICLVAGLAALSPTPPTAWAIGEPLALLIRAAATLIGAIGFAILYNSAWRTVLLVGVLALVGNDLRLGLNDVGMALAPATFLGALTVGLLASLVRTLTHEPRIALTVPAIVIMVPGTPIYTAVVRLAQSDFGGAVPPLVAAIFVLSAMAIALVIARLVTEPRWLFDP